MHGDHLFGLPGFLCTLASGTSTTPVTIYGPLGLREYIETTFRLSHSWLSSKFDIVELIPNAYDEVDENLVQTTLAKQEKHERFRTVSISEDGRYHLTSDEDNCSVYAASIKHRVPTYG